jgi:hypothetical protein
LWFTDLVANQLWFLVFCVIKCDLLFYILRSPVAYCGSLAGMSPANFRGHPVGVEKSWFHPGFTPWITAARPEKIHRKPIDSYMG